MVALGTPSDRDLGSWSFQRYVAELPVPSEFTLFERSWRSGIRLIKYYLDITKDEQQRRIASRRRAPSSNGRSAPSMNKPWRCGRSTWHTTGAKRFSL